MAFTELVGRFVRDLEASNATVIVVPGQDKPARLRVITSDSVTHCLVFLWKITPGGGKSASRPSHERRIQVTAAERFPLEVGARTIIGGWTDERAAWGFWDVMRHTSFSDKSPSFQISDRTLDRAFGQGVATQAKKPAKSGLQEIAVAVSSPVSVHGLTGSY